MMELFKKQDKIDVFWTWFIENLTEIDKIDDVNNEEILNLILNNVQEIAEGLSIEISLEHNGIRDLVISPEGDIEKFELVKDIVKRAPTIKGWTFTAFRQAVKDDFTLEYEDLEFTASEMFFYPHIDGDSLDIIIYAKNISHYDPEAVEYYGLVTMDNVLGEYDSVMRVRHFDFHDLNEVKNKNKLKPLRELKAFVESFYTVRQN